MSPEPTFMVGTDIASYYQMQTISLVQASIVSLAFGLAACSGSESAPDATSPADAGIGEDVGFLDLGAEDLGPDGGIDTDGAVSGDGGLEAPDGAIVEDSGFDLDGQSFDVDRFTDGPMADSSTLDGSLFEDAGLNDRGDFDGTIDGGPDDAGDDDSGFADTGIIVVDVGTDAGIDVDGGNLGDGSIGIDGGLGGFCGDGICDPSLGESPSTCPIDCN